MSTSLKSIPATIAPDGTVTLSEPIELGSITPAMVTIAVENSDSDNDAIDDEALKAATDAVFGHYEPLLKELAK